MANQALARTAPALAFLGPLTSVDISPKRRKLVGKITPIDSAYPLPGDFATIHGRYGDLSDLLLQDVWARGVALPHLA